MTEPTLDDVRAHCELNAGMFEAQAEALRAKVGGGAGEVQAFNAAIYRLALAALDDAERWRKANRLAKLWVEEGCWCIPARDMLRDLTFEEAIDAEVRDTARQADDAR